MKSLPLMPRSRSPRFALPLVLVVLAAAATLFQAPAARAHVNSGANCASCHSASRSGMSVTGFQLTTNLGAGALKVFQVLPGQTIPIGIQVTDGHNEYGLALVNLGGGGIQDPAHRLAFQADSSWTRRTTNPNYYSVGPSGSNKAWTFRLAVQAGTPADFYLLQMRMAGQSSSRWNQEERFYVQVLKPTPAAPRMNQPSWKAGVFTCTVPTSAGFTYRLERKPDPAAQTWTVVAETAGDGSARTLSDPGAASTAAIYRVRVE